MDQFKRVENMKKCLTIFERYMNDKYNVDIYLLKDCNPRVTLYQIMTDIGNTPQFVNMNTDELNNIAINRLRNVYVEKYTLVENRKLQVASLDRERQVHGQRAVNDYQFKPINTKAEVHEKVDKEFERLMAIRKGSAEDARQKPATDKTILDKAWSNDEFQSKMTEIEKARGDLLASSVDIMKLHEGADPKAFYETVLQSNTEKQQHAKTLRNEGTEQTYAPTPSYEHHARKDLIPLASFRESPYQYLAINGFDRDWDYYKNRFQFTVDMSQMSRSYRNICEMSFTKLIVPSEILEERTLTNVPKTNYVHNFRFAFPYLLLMVDEFADVYDGRQNATQRAFAHFVYETHYNAPNGRGYILLYPVQNETKFFTPSPLASIQRLSLTIAKPNGTIFNQSQDHNHIWKVEYEDYNRLYLKIVLEKYFDKNEFFPGDSIMIRNYRMPFFTTQSGPEYADYVAHKYEYDVIMAFLNRPEGHEIVEIGQPNEEGFYRTFHINAPNKMDPTLGRYTIEKDLVDTIQAYNQQNYACCMHPTPTGSIINASLQFTLTMSLRTAVGDAAKTLMPQII